MKKEKKTIGASFSLKTEKKKINNKNFIFYILGIMDIK